MGAPGAEKEAVAGRQKMGAPSGIAPRERPSRAIQPEQL